jgi:hypothetical protein
MPSRQQPQQMPTPQPAPLRQPVQQQPIPQPPQPTTPVAPATPAQPPASRPDPREDKSGNNPYSSDDLDIPTFLRKKH